MIPTPPPPVIWRVLFVKGTLKNPQTTVNGTFVPTWAKYSSPLVGSALSHYLKSNRAKLGRLAARSSTCRPLTWLYHHLLYGWAVFPPSGLPFAGPRRRQNSPGNRLNMLWLQPKQGWTEAVLQMAAGVREAWPG